MKIELYHTVRAVQHGIPFSRFHFLSILELYYPETDIFFTPVGKMGLALHELYEVSSLPIGEFLCEEYVITGEELHLLHAQDALVYDTYWELMCHFHICRQMTKLRNQGVKQRAWVEYLFSNLCTDGNDLLTLLTCMRLR